MVSLLVVYNIQIHVHDTAVGKDSLHLTAKSTIVFGECVGLLNARNPKNRLTMQNAKTMPMRIRTTKLLYCVTVYQFNPADARIAVHVASSVALFLKYFHYSSMRYALQHHALSI